MNEDDLRAIADSLNLEEGEMVTDAVLIANVSSLEQGSGIAIGGTEGLSWIIQLGLIRAAELAITGSGS